MSERAPLNPSSKSIDILTNWAWNEDHMSEEGMEHAVASLVLVCALILTVPYELIGNMNTEFWDNVDYLAQDCPEFGYDSMAT